MYSARDFEISNISLMACGLCAKGVRCLHAKDNRKPVKMAHFDYLCHIPSRVGVLLLTRRP